MQQFQRIVRMNNFCATHFSWLYNKYAPHIKIAIYINLHALEGRIPAFKSCLGNGYFLVHFYYCRIKCALIAWLIKSQMFPSRPLNSMGCSTGGVWMTENINNGLGWKCEKRIQFHGCITLKMLGHVWLIILYYWTAFELKENDCNSNKLKCGLDTPEWTTLCWIRIK